MRQLPEDVLRTLNEYENAVAAKAVMEHSGALAKTRDRVLREYTDTKKVVLNFFREVYGLEQLP